MRILPGIIPHDSDATTTERMLLHATATRPEILPSVFNMWEDHESTFTSILARKQSARGIFAGMNTPNFRMVGNTQVQWAEEGPSRRKGRIISHDGGQTPGAGHAVFEIRVTTDWFSKNDILEFEDRDQHVVVLSKRKITREDCFYRVKYVTNRDGGFLNPSLLAQGREVGQSHTIFPELSEDAGEKHVYPGWNTEFLTIQRHKHTISGTADATKVGIIHNGEFLWDYRQNLLMRQRQAFDLENQLLFGRATMDSTGMCYITDDEGRDLPAGNGIVNQGDPSMTWRYNHLTIRHIERVLEDIDLMSTGYGSKEVLVLCGQTFFNDFQRIMRDVLQMNPAPLVVNDGEGGKAIKTNFTSYSWSGVNMILARCYAFDDPSRPIERDEHGNNYSSSRAFFVSMGNTLGGNPNVELLTLGNSNTDRRMITRVINGMAGDGPFVPGSKGESVMLASSPVDGKQIHTLMHTGVIMRNSKGFAQLKRHRRA